uniref:Candidate secreted effector n=1 Tax=Meloidogyne incognita TaxID=6306 RepID=A0A914KK37_MELIC
MITNCSVLTSTTRSTSFTAASSTTRAAATTWSNSLKIYEINQEPEHYRNLNIHRFHNLHLLLRHHCCIHRLLRCIHLRNCHLLHLRCNLHRLHHCIHFRNHRPLRLHCYTHLLITTTTVNNYGT